MKRASLALTAISGAALLGAAATASAQGDEERIEYRQAVFTVIAGNFSPMGDMVEGEIPYDAETFARNAERVAQLSGMALEGFEDGPHAGDTDAEDATWERWSDFQAADERFREAAASLAEASAGGDEPLEAVQGPFLEVAQACQNCHDDFRDN